VTRYVTATGYELEIGRLGREEIDGFLARDPPPEPPEREVEVFGGDVELVPDRKDPDYQAALADWQRRVFVDETALIAGAVRVGAAPEGDVEALVEALGFEPDEVDVLRFAALTDEGDRERVVDEVMYLSTVTPRGIAEAAERFGVEWAGKPVLEYRLGGSPAEYTQRFEDWMAATEARMSWSEFCALSGPKQSEVVAFWRLRMRLDYLRRR
jgi:hypothetical protein